MRELLHGAGRPLPKAHLIAKNRITQYMGSASAYAAVLNAIEADIGSFIKINPEIFTFNTPAKGFVEVRDFQTTGVVGFTKGLPFSQVRAVKQTINEHRVQVKQDYLDNCISALEALVNPL